MGKRRQRLRTLFRPFALFASPAGLVNIASQLFAVAIPEILNVSTGLAIA